VGARLWRWFVRGEVRPIEVVGVVVAVATVVAATLVGQAANRIQEKATRQQASDQLHRDANARTEGLTSRDAYRDGQGDTPHVSLWTQRPRPATPYLDHRTVFNLDNRSPDPISGFQLLLDLKDPGSPDSTTAGAVRLSTSASVPGCTRLTFTAPPGLDLDALGPELRGKQIYLQDPQLFFVHLDREFQLREAGAIIAKPAENSPPGVFPGHRYVNATPIGEITRIRSAPLDCLARD
jgi:hypothetical protein